MQEPDTSSEEPRLVSVRTMEIAVAIVFLILSAVVISDSLRLGMRWRAIEGPASGYFPFYIGLIMGIASLVNLVQAIVKGVQERRSWTVEASGRRVAPATQPRPASFVSRQAFKQVLAVLIPLTFYVIVLNFIGIYVASALYIALFMWHFGRYPVLRCALIGIGVALALFLMFEVWFLVPLPKGPLEDMLGY